MGNARAADAQSSVQGSITRDDPIPSPHLAGDPQHVADSGHPPPETQVRMNLPSRPLAHGEGRDTALAPGPTSSPWGHSPWGDLGINMMPEHEEQLLLRHVPFEKRREWSHGFARWLLALFLYPRITGRVGEPGIWQYEIKSFFRQWVCFWSGLPGEQSGSAVAEQGCFVFFFITGNMEAANGPSQKSGPYRLKCCSVKS